MVSPVLFYHQDHPVKVEATKTAAIMALNMLTNIVAPFFRHGGPSSPEHAAQITPFVG